VGSKNYKITGKLKFKQNQSDMKKTQFYLFRILHFLLTVIYYLKSIYSILFLTCIIPFHIVTRSTEQNNCVIIDYLREV